MGTATKAELAPQEANRNCMNEPTKAIQFLIDTAPLYAKAKADRMYLEEFRKSRKAQLASQAGPEVLGKQETYAYAHADYIEILEGIRQAVEKEERFRWLMTAAQARIEVWRTEQYSARMELKATQ
jgi:cytochrome c biogenesis protein ResB